MKSFELCAAETAPVSERHIWTRHRIDPPAPQVGMSHAGSKPLPGGIGHLTVLIGANGTGKTQLLSSIASAFQQLSRWHTVTRNQRDFPLHYLNYELEGDRFEVRKRNSTLELFKNDKLTSLDQFRFPQRVVALATTSHDRFPLPIQSERVDPSRTAYRYMGLRDRSGRSSLLSALYTALNNLFEAATNRAERRDRITAVFELLKYIPEVTVYYTFRISRNRIHEALRSDDIWLSLWGDYERRRALSILNESRSASVDIRPILLAALKIAEESRYISVSVDLSSGYVDPFVQDLQLLRRLGILSTRSVEVCRVDGTIVDLKRASSGEMSIAATFISLASVLEDQSLILIDEPEVSLHPEWQAKYVDLLTRTFAGYEGCHYVLATHSPLILSDIPDEAAVISLDADEKVEGAEVSGESADKLLAKFFKVPTANNLYLRDQLVSALRLAADGDMNSQSFVKVVQNLEEMAVNIDKDEPVQKVIAALGEAKDAGSYDA